MTIPYHLADLIPKASAPISQRKSLLLQSREHYEKFLKLLDSYDMLGRSDTKLWESYLDDRDSFSTTTVGQGSKDAAARREGKIRRFKEEMELKRKLEVCFSIPLSYRTILTLNSIYDKTQNSESRTSKYSESFT